ncbi:hypothetical protein JMA_34060 [Jeotgalibacillus malaysiensis]|uniref:Right handed beta helix domain-containing protein n=1 Tax=Jeotgalibacillus malaysiensis TaxID=1508404 RepID=A0A0B5AVU3_9BACL|nr:right-handed parallel beta-helix repeat-containing protein [Jeotgalibacillus malaysiensis]AJD92723.1 hypothetical protein JMA_34060 [Jeotgalibacillus malaysiensis]
MKKHLFFTLLAFTIVAMLPTIVSAEGITSSIQEKVYVLTDQEKKRWGISDDASNPVETTAGWNQALKWAGEQGYTTFRVEDGHYLIAKGEKWNSPNNHIKMVSNMKLSLDDDVILEKETNGWEMYSVLYLSDLENVIVEGGTLKGDRLTHDYSQVGEATSGTHEWGNGISIKGSQNIIINDMKIQDFAGDSVEIGGATEKGYYIKEKDLEQGGLSASGGPINSEEKIRSTFISIDQKLNEFSLYFWLPQNLKSNRFNIHYYDQNKKHISKQENLKFYWGEVKPPKNAQYYRAEFGASDTSKVSINPMYVNTSKNIRITNSNLGYSRRQGISIVGGENVLVKNNEIHHVKGTAPQSGIDLEGGFFVNKNNRIESNYFHNNHGYDIILFDGYNAEVVNNRLESKSIGLAVSPPFSEALIEGNTFKTAGITILGENIDLKNNNLSGSTINLSGENISLINTLVKGGNISLNNKKPHTVKIDELEVVNSPFYIGSNPVNISNLTLKGEKTYITGKGNVDNQYSKVTTEELKGLTLPGGKYQNCSINSSLNINHSVPITIDNCTVNAKESLLNTSNQATVEMSRMNFNLIGNVGYGAGIFVKDTNSFKINNSKIQAVTNQISTPIMKFGPYGEQKASEINQVSIKDVDVYGNPNSGVNIGIDTTNSGIDAPVYSLVNLNVYNAKTLLKPTDKIQSSEDTRNKRVPKLREWNP